MDAKNTIRKIEEETNKKEEKLRNEELKVLEQRLAIAKKELTKNKKIPLKVFETYLLAYILGIVDRNDENRDRFVYNYIELTGSPSSGLDVVDDKNNVIYTLPPLLSDIDLNKFNKINFATIGKKYYSYKEANPVMAEGYLSNVTYKISEKTDINIKFVKEYVNLALKLIKDYEEVLKANGVKVETETNTNNNDGLDDFLEF